MLTAYIVRAMSKVALMMEAGGTSERRFVQKSALKCGLLSDKT
jgi:hypothetical protein